MMQQKSGVLMQKTEMWRLPPMYVGPYAEQDAALTLKLWDVLRREIVKQELIDVFKLETDLFSCFI